jgi:hypothetical protein
MTVLLPKRFVVLFVLVIGLAATSGCGGESVTSATDAQILSALDYYDPVYQMDANGRLFRLMLSHNLVPDATLALVGKLSALYGLELYDASFNEDSLVYLQNLRGLRELNLAYAPVTDRGLEHLLKIEGLQYLWLSRGRFSPGAVEKLKDAGITIYWQ